jgi:hypothetical protein
VYVSPHPGKLVQRELYFGEKRLHCLAGGRWHFLPEDYPTAEGMWDDPSRFIRHFDYP